MKRIVSLLVALCVLCGSVPRIDQGGFMSEAPAPGAGPVIFVIGVTVVAGVAVWYIWVKLKQPAPGGLYWWALEKSQDHVNWTPVATNGLKMVEEKAWECFEIQRQADSSAFYRLRMIEYYPVGGTNLLYSPYVICGTEIERPILQP